MFASKDVFLSKSGAAGAYTIGRSVRLRASATAYLSRTPASASNRTTWTWSSWVKFGLLTGAQTLFEAQNGTTFSRILIDGNLNLSCQGGTSNVSTTFNVATSAVIRDPSSWYHLVISFDTTQATAANRVRVYINGVQMTAFATATYPTQNSTWSWNAACLHNIGRYVDSTFGAGGYADGYLAEMNFVDGQALTPSSFGATSTNGVWQPTKYTGTYGTNGFYLNFSSNGTAAALGTDSSGNSNTWTVNNISVTAGVTYDSMTDVPTLTSATAANYPTWNPLWQGRTNAPTNGNLDYPASSVGIGTMALSGSSYWEITSTGGTSTVALYSTAASTSQAVTTGLTYGFRFNATTGAFDYTTNGSSFTSIATGLTSGPYFFYVSTAASTTASLNAGQRPFNYTAPTGFVALNTYNLSTPTIPNGAAYMAASLYTGTGAAQSITNTVNGVSFQPDFVWFKCRSIAYQHNLFDVIRGAGQDLRTNSTAAEITTAEFTSFNSNGWSFSGVTTNGFNDNAATYVGWNWKANGTGVSNTSGSITSTVSAGTTQGFAVVTYTGTGAAATVGHGLGVTPSMIIFKNRADGTTSWCVYHTSLGISQQVFLNTTAAATTVSNKFSGTNSSVIGINTGTDVNGSTNAIVAYVFAAVAGYSAFGTYTGNGSTDGPFVYLGFRPRWVMVKRTDSTSDWYIWDTSRDTYNVATATLLADTSGAETSATSIDDLSNGFKCRSATVVNVSTGTYIYAAFAENPFKYSLAR